MSWGAYKFPNGSAFRRGGEWVDDLDDKEYHKGGAQITFTPEKEPQSKISKHCESVAEDAIIID